MIRSGFLGLLAALLFMSFFAVSSASASLYIKNNTNKTIWYTHTFHDSCSNGCNIYHGLADGWRNIGWYKIEPNKKVKVKNGDERRWFYWYAYQEGGVVSTSSSYVWEVPPKAHDGCWTCVDCITSHPGPHQCHSASDHKGHGATWKSADDFTINLNP